MKLNIEDFMVTTTKMFTLLLFNYIYLLDRIEEARKALSWLYGDKDDNQHVIKGEINILKDTLVQRKSRWVFDIIPITYEIIL